MGIKLQFRCDKCGTIEDGPDEVERSLCQTPSKEAFTLIGIYRKPGGWRLAFNSVGDLLCLCGNCMAKHGREPKTLPTACVPNQSVGPTGT